MNDNPAPPDFDSPEVQAAIAWVTDDPECTEAHMNLLLKIGEGTESKLETSARILADALRGEHEKRVKAEAELAECKGDPYAGNPAKWPHESQIQGLHGQLDAAQKRIRDMEMAHERESLKLIDERDECADVIERLLAAAGFVNGTHYEWSNHFGYEEAIAMMDETIPVINETVEKLLKAEAERDRLRTALEFYANESHWDNEGTFGNGEDEWKGTLSDRTIFVGDRNIIDYADGWDAAQAALSPQPAADGEGKP